METNWAEENLKTIRVALHDSPWKEALRVYFQPFLALFFPDAHSVAAQRTRHFRGTSPRETPVDDGLRAEQATDRASHHGRPAEGHTGPAKAPARRRSSRGVLLTPADSGAAAMFVGVH